MEEYIIELKEILLRIENLNKEISDLSILLNKHEEEMDKIDNKINNSLFNIKDRIDYLNAEKKNIKDKISNLEISKRILKVKIITTIVSIICFGTSLVIGKFNIVSALFLVTSITGFSTMILNILSNKKKKKELEKYNLEKIDSCIKMENNKLNDRYSKLDNLFEKKERLRRENFILNEKRFTKTKMVVHLESEKRKIYNELISLLEDEVKLSNQELDGQLEILGFSKIKRR